MLLENIDKKLEGIYEKYQQNTIDKTGWSFLRKLKKEANFHPFLFSFFVYRTFEIAYQKREIINCEKIIIELIHSFWHEEYYLPNQGRNTSKEDKKEFFSGLVFFKGILTRVLEELQLKETLMAFYCLLAIKEEEIKESNYLTEKQIEKFGKLEKIDGNEQILKPNAEITKIFEEEYKKKCLDKKPRIIRI